MTEDMADHNSNSEMSSFPYIHLLSSRKLYRKIKDPAQRFWSKTRPGENGCIEWAAHKTPQGYGQFSWMSEPVLAHRWVYEASRGLIPEGMVIDHLCRNRACVNVDHLECVTMGENTRRGTLHDVQRAKAKTITHCRHGHPLFGDNLLITSSGHRSCRKCQRANAKAWVARNREHVNELQRIRRAQGAK